MASAPPPLQQNRLAGIGMRLGATTSFAVMAAAIKLGHEAGVALPELVFWRFAFGLPPVLGWMALTGQLDAWRTRRPLAHVTRGALGLVAMALTFSSLAFLPLAEATTINFVAPLFAVMLSALLLGERVGRHRWSAVALGFAGVLIVMRPAAAGADLPALGLALALLGAAAVAAVQITLRTIARTESTAAIVLWFTLLAMAVSGATLPFFAARHDAWQWAMLVVIGLAGGVGQLFLTASLRFAAVAVVAPFDYVQLFWAVLFGWLLWSTQPPATTWLGAAVIAASGLYTLYREHRLGRERVRVPPMAG